MADQAKITSIEALETLRASLIIFLNKAHSRIDEVGDEIRRMRMWIQNDQRLRWESEIRKRRRILEQAEQELLTARLSSMRENNSLQMLAARRAREALAEAEEKLKNVRRWSRDFEFSVEPLWKKLGNVRSTLDHNLPKAIAYLNEAQKNLVAYAEAGMEKNDPLPSAAEPLNVPPS